MENSSCKISIEALLSDSHSSPHTGIHASSMIYPSPALDPLQLPTSTATFAQGSSYGTSVEQIPSGSIENHQQQQPLILFATGQGSYPTPLLQPLEILSHLQPPVNLKSIPILSTSSLSQSHDATSKTSEESTFKEGTETANYRQRRRCFDEVERYYKCDWENCDKSYGTLNHLNHHVVLQKHGPRRKPEEFKELRRWLKRKVAITKEQEQKKKLLDEIMAEQARMQPPAPQLIVLGSMNGPRVLSLSYINGNPAWIYEQPLSTDTCQQSMSKP